MTTKPVAILLVEDDVVDQKVVTRAFHDMKIANPIHIAGNGLKALAMLRGHDGHTQISRPYIILLDLNMPQMNGIEFLQELRKDPEHKSAVVFVLTTSKAEEDRVAAYDSIVAGYVVKSNVGPGFMKLVDMIDHYWKIVELP